MDRFKTSVLGSKRPKAKGNPAGLELIPLGGKRDGSETSGAKLAASASAAIKRDSPVPAGSVSLLAKRVKTSSFSPQRSDSPYASSSSMFKHEEMIIECPLPELYDRIEEADEDSDTTDGLICGALKHLRVARHKPSPKVLSALMYLVKVKPLLFATDTVTAGLCSLLRRDTANAYKAKGNPTVTVLVCNLLYAAYYEDDYWPQQFVEVYIEDSLGDRLWVDRTDCKSFVDNISTAFNTNLTPKNPTLLESSNISLSLTSSAGSTMSPNASPFHTPSNGGGEGAEPSAEKSESGPSAKPIVRHRYKFQMDSIELLVTEMLQEQLIKRQHLEVGNKSLLKLLTNVCGYGTVRQTAVVKLEAWLQNPKLSRVAQELLLCICLNCSGQEHTDKDVIVNLLKLRLKNKQLLSHYLSCLRELLEHGEENMRVIMTHTIYNELSTGTRNQNNMQLLSLMFQQAENRAPEILADVFAELLMNSEDYLRALRALLREMVRTLRADIVLQPFCAALMKDRSLQPLYMSVDPTIKERVVLSVANLIALCQFLSISPAVREASTQQPGNQKKDMSYMYHFWHQIAQIQRDSAIWVHDTLLRMHPQLEPAHFVHCLYHTLMMAEKETYYRVDGWPGEAERQLMLRLVSETPVLEETIIRVLMIGLESNARFKPSDALEVCELMINRAAALKTVRYNTLEVKDDRVIKLLLTTPVYHHPENIALPAGYLPPQLAITNFYWKMWSTMLVLAALNPSTVGDLAWQHYPSARSFMEMAITGSYNFPPISSAHESDKMLVQDRQITELEKQEILEFEGHLAAASSSVPITESNSLLLSQVIAINPVGPARKPPRKVLESLENLDKSLKLGHMLCKSREPDFLMDLINKQGARAAMPWLSNLVQANEGSLEVLPTQCLCEFLLYGLDEDSADNQFKKPSRQEKLLQKLQSIISQADDDTDADHLKMAACSEMFEYFFSRLHSPSARARRLSSLALMKLLTPRNSEGIYSKDHWLLDIIPDLKIYQNGDRMIQSSLHKALLLETRLTMVECYIRYLLSSRLYRHEPALTILMISKLLVDRPTLGDKVLKQGGVLKEIISAFNDIVDDSKTRKTLYNWGDESETVKVTWASGQHAVLDLTVIRACVLLVCQSERAVQGMETLTDEWFPQDSPAPVGVSTATAEEVVFYPNSLKLQMVRSTEERVVTAALVNTDLKDSLTLLQMFGIPTSSVSLILKHIESLCQNLSQNARRMIESQSNYLSMLLSALQTKSEINIGDKFREAVGVNKYVEPMETDPVQSNSPIDADVTVEADAVTSRCGSAVPTSNQRAWYKLVMQMVKSEGNSNTRDSPLRQINRMLVQSPSNRSEFLSTLQQMLTSDPLPTLLQYINSNTSSFCKMIRLACSDRNTEAEELMELVKDNPRLSFPLCVTKTLSSLGKPEAQAATHKPIVQATTIKQEPDVKRAKTDVVRRKALSQTAGQPSKEEAEFNALMSRLYINGDKEQAISQLITTLHKQPAGPDASGIATDWLQIIDPEMVSVSPLQMNLIFNKRNDDTQKAGQQSSPHFQSLLAHDSNWSTLRRTLFGLLDSFSDSRNATSVLDFVTDCKQHPRLYQGREKNKVASPGDGENILNLNSKRMISMVQYIYAEQKTITEKLPEDQCRMTLIRRGKLLSSCIHKPKDIKAVVTYLQPNSSGTSRDSTIYRRILVLLYCLKPEVSALLTDESLLHRDQAVALIAPCSLDREIHSALSALSNLKAGRKSVIAATQANLVCRRLAAQHPILVLRHVGVLSSLVSGRMFSNYNLMIQTNKLVLYTLVLGITELLQPHIYHHPEWLTIVNSYFTLIKVHGMESDEVICGLYAKFFAMLASFYSALPDQCVHIISQHKNLLNCLQHDQRFSKIGYLKTLATASFMPPSRESVGSGELSSSGFATMDSFEANSSGGFTVEQITPTLRKLRPDSSNDDVLAALNDLNATSQVKVEILSKFQDELRRQIRSSNPTIRNLSYLLAKRWITHNPKAAIEYTDTIIQCLQDPDSNIMKSAIQNVTEICLLLPKEGRSTLLVTAFNQAALSGMDEHVNSLNNTLQMVSLNSFNIVNK